MNNMNCLIIPGTFDDWKRADISLLTQLSQRTIRKKAENFEAVKNYLEKVSYGDADCNIGILMRIPFAEIRQYCVVGPVFAALLLHEYKLAERIIDKYKWVEMSGTIVSYSFEKLSEDFFEPYIYIDQLFLTDMNIPKKLLLKLRACDGFFYSAEHNVVDNNLITIIDNNFLLPSLYDITEACGKSPYLERFKKLKRKCPEIFGEIFLEILISENVWEQIFYCGRLSEVQDICGVIYNEHFDYSRAVLAFFNCETTALICAINAGQITEGCIERYIANVRKVYRLIKSDSDVDTGHFKGFIRTLFAIVYYMDNHEKLLFWGTDDEIEALIGRYYRRIKNILKKCISEVGIDGLVFTDVLLTHDLGDMVCPGIEKLFGNSFSVEMYLNYIISFMKMFNRYTHIKIADEEKLITLFMSKLDNLSSDGMFFTCKLKEANSYSGEEDWDRVKKRHINEFYTCLSKNA
ncbi:hypothetical protein SAMN02910276_01810 [Butyrivibrio sp. Su6]|uniref:hypothetical protein n=1 Tax=Butyrivibrio sp. Su6 TaxID=1520810 RepID=UPI00089EA51E|nr:hypothetical protein [Butyrivibrio sp. Su6]SEG08549.1 hypothetical protein SAMN02910276_01810 [Butyrivibrio sp. Su6]